MTQPYQQALQLAITAASKAGALQLQRQHAITEINIKPDSSPVSEVDALSEQIIIQLIREQFPEDGILAEESGEIAGKNDRLWVIDPLDGTRPYLRHIPTYSCLIALLVAGDPVVGVIHLPALGRTYQAAKGIGAFCNDRRLTVSNCRQLTAALITGHGFVPKADTNLAHSLHQVLGAANYTYGFMDAFSYGLVAAGSLEACISLTDKPWDCAAAACIIREAGGKFSDEKGRQTIFGEAFIASNGLLHSEILSFFHG